MNLQELLQLQDLLRKGVFLGFADTGSWEDKSPGALALSFLTLPRPLTVGKGANPIRRNFMSIDKLGWKGWGKGVARLEL